MKAKIRFEYHPEDRSIMLYIASLEKMGFKRYDDYTEEVPEKKRITVIKKD
jgi:hypothetical protein